MSVRDLVILSLNKHTPNKPSFCKATKREKREPPG